MKDDFKMMFNEELPFLSFLQDLEKEARWLRTPTDSLRAVTAKNINAAARYATLPELELYQDTVENTGLFVKFGKEEFPVGSTAMPTYYARCRIGGSALREISKDDLRTILNKCIKVGKGTALVYVAGEKVRAIHAGDENDYAILPMTDVFKTAGRVLRKDFSDVEFLNGFYDHMLTVGRWSVKNKGITDAYEQLLPQAHASDQARCIISVNTSNTGFSGANIHYSLMDGTTTIFCGRAIKLEHKNHANMQNFKEHMELILTKFKESITDLENLKKIVIQNPDECMYNIMVKAGIGRKLAAETVEKRQVLTNSGKCNAFELYLDICQCVDLAIAEGMDNGRLISDLEEKVSSCIFMKWQEYDIPQIKQRTA